MSFTQRKHPRVNNFCLHLTALLALVLVVQPVSGKRSSACSILRRNDATPDRPQDQADFEQAEQRLQERLRALDLVRNSSYYQGL